MYELFAKEKTIMDIFWRLDKPCLISEILKEDTTLSRNTVAKSLVKLEQEGYLKVDSIRRTVTRTGRAYVPTISKDEYDRQIDHLRTLAKSVSLSDSTLKVLSSMFEADSMEDGFIEKLESMIAAYKNKKNQA